MNRNAYIKLDSYWQAVADFISLYLAADDRVIAPSEINRCFPGDRCHSYEDGYVGKYQWVVVHKGMLKMVESRGLLAACLALDPVFANEVFVIFATRKRFKKIDDGNIHYKSFLDVLANEFVPECLERNGVGGPG